MFDTIRLEFDDKQHHTILFAISLCENIATLGYESGIKKAITVFGSDGRKRWKSVEKHILQLSPQKLSSFTFSQLGKEIGYQMQHPQHINSLEDFDVFVKTTDQRLLKRRSNKRTPNSQ